MSVLAIFPGLGVLKADSPCVPSQSTELPATRARIALRTTDREPVTKQEAGAAKFSKPSSNQYAGRNCHHAGVVVKMV